MTIIVKLTSLSGLLEGVLSTQYYYIEFIYTTNHTIQF